MDTITLIALVACIAVLGMQIAVLLRGDGYRFDERRRRWRDGPLPRAPKRREEDQIATHDRFAA